MNKVAMLSLSVVVAAACSDSPMGPTMTPDPGEPMFTAFHTTIPAPSVTGSAAGEDVTVSWVWSDNEDWDKLVSFTLLRDGEEIGAGEIANEKPYTANFVVARSYTDAGLEDGTYEYCVEVMAKHNHGGEDGKTTVTNHNRSCVSVSVGGVVYTVEILRVNGRGATWDNDAGTVGFKKSGDFTFFVALFADGVEVACTVAIADVEATATFATPAAVAGSDSSATATGCGLHGSTGRNRYEFTLTNLANNQESSGGLAFSVGGQAADNAFTFAAN